MAEKERGWTQTVAFVEFIDTAYATGLISKGALKV